MECRAQPAAGGDDGEALDDVLSALLEVQLQNDDDTAPEVASFASSVVTCASAGILTRRMTAQVQRESVR